MRRSWRNLSIGLFLFTLVLGGLLGDRLLAVTDETRQSLKAYTELLNAAQDRFGADLTYRDLVFASIQGMLRVLDPHTNFLPPSAFSSMRERQQGSFYGLGILVGTRNNQLTVITPLEGTPAARLGIRAGDVISAIEGESTAKMTIDEAVQKLKGPKDTQVRISIVRYGLAEPLELTITRAEIPQTTVRYAYMMAPDTGYLAISDFSRSTGGEVARALDTLRAQGMKRLLLDLRNDGGGLLDQCIEVADQFLPKDAKIVETRGRTRESFQEYRAAGEHPAFGLPLVVLVNGGTASAAEILSGAIQDHDVGLIVGTATWGKGLVQTVYNLSYGAGLALTTAKYYTPSGRLIQRDYSSYYDYYSGPEEAIGDEAQPAHPAPQGEAFSTDLGRKVYGGGGITPDVIVEPRDLSPYLQFLLSRSAFFNYALEYLGKHKVASRDWQPGSEVLDSFSTWLVEQKIDTADDVVKGLAAPEDRAVALRQIRAEVFNSVFGNQAWHQVLAGGDHQVQEALGLFDRSAALLAQRQALPEQPTVQAAELPRD